MKKLFNKKAMLISGTILTVSALLIGAIYAFDFSPKKDESITDAIKAADVCEDHLLKDCDECGGIEVYSSYRTTCPYCDKNMTLCCSGQVAKDDYYASCLVSSHPDGCNTVQDLYWNAYFCTECGYFTRGSREDDYHVEAYWHTKETCYDHAYCSKPRLSDLISVYTANNVECCAEVDCTEENNAVAAADVCGVCGNIGCTICH